LYTVQDFYVGDLDSVSQDIDSRATNRYLKKKQFCNKTTYHLRVLNMDKAANPNPIHSPTQF